MRKPAFLALEDGSLFQGQSIGIDGHAQGEVVFNTSITGYQEILTDPSYCRQIITLTHPHIGNVGTSHHDEESSRIHAGGLVVRDYSLVSSNWRSQSSLEDYLLLHKTVAIAGIDTRRLTRLLREKGAQNGCLIAGDNPNIELALRLAREFPGLKGTDLVQTVSTPSSYSWTKGSWQLAGNNSPAVSETRFHVVAYDFGVKQNILRMLADRGCRLTVVPAQTSARDVLAMQPDGVFLSNGPGDPEPCDYAITAIGELLDAAVPLFGICLGHQLLALASGAQTLKMKFGHHGGNHPVLDLESGRVMISSQNHGFAVDEATLPSTLRATHRSLFDGTLQGIRHTDQPAFSFQGHPEASPGPHDVASLFDRFIKLLETRREHA